MPAQPLTNCHQSHPAKQPAEISRYTSSHTEIVMTDFSSKRGSLDIFRYLILAEPFDACSPLKLSSANKYLNDDFFVLADGKNCSYRKKSHIAKEMGAVGIIIIDDDSAMAKEYYYGVRDTRMLSFLIATNEGMIIKDYMVNN